MLSGVATQPTYLPPRYLASRTQLIGLICTGSLAFTACSSSDRPMTRPASRGAVTAIAAPTGTFESVCSYFVATRVLNHARDLVTQGGSADARAVASVHAELGRVLAVVPRVMRLAVENINNQVGSENSPQVVPDTNLLQGECRARNLPYPTW